MNKLTIAAGLGLALMLGSCATQPATPQEAYLNRYALAEVAATQCPAYGGYASATAMRADAQANLAKAQALGITDKDIAKARNRANGNFVVAASLTNPMQACSAAINSIAWAGTSTPVIKPKKPTKAAPAV